jgi:hypothetical protein
MGSEIPRQLQLPRSSLHFFEKFDCGVVTNLRRAQDKSHKSSLAFDSVLPVHPERSD